MAKGIYINDSIHGLIGLSEFEKEIVSTVSFNRLHDVYQNSTVYLTFPSNRTKRFEHSIGTMKLCSDMLFHSVQNANEGNVSRFCSCYAAEMNRVLKDIINNISKYEFLPRTPTTLPKIENDSFRLSLIPRNVTNDNMIVYIIVAEAVRISALLHDIGHPPFSHVVERAMRGAYMISCNKKHKVWREYHDRMEKYFSGMERALHEVMGDEISESILRETAREVTDKKRDDEILFRVFVLECVLRIFNESSPAFEALHRLIDGSLDGDRLDYVTRDPLNSGMNSGSIDYSRIISDMQMIMDKDVDGNDKPLFCVPVKAVNAVEDFLKRRYDLYKTIIMHHRVIKTDYLLEHSVKSLIEEYMSSNRTKKGTDENSITFDISGLWYPLGQATLEEKGNELSQWNDSWLMTVLKKTYFTEYYRNNDIEEGTTKYIIEKQLAELLRHKKSYYSLIKRSEDFQHIDKSIKQCIERSKNNLESKLDILENEPDNCNGKRSKKKPKEKYVVMDIDGTIAVINEILRRLLRNEEGYVVSFIMQQKKYIGIKNLEDAIQKIVRRVCEEVFANVYDTIIVFKSISVGTEEHEIYFYDSDLNVYGLDQISGVAKSIRQENLFRPPFYIYSLIHASDEAVKKKKTDCLFKIGYGIGEFIVDQINKILDELIDGLKPNIGGKKDVQSISERS